ncbi:MAG: sugar phosphate isomerase/epimerase [Deltaproteobacteria bacterium]|jgi:sugar phosphate isomerase/epimerase|nr:sugar phosphate isomerase/epimerase [Deltaproteobacteria bacterium]
MNKTIQANVPYKMLLEKLDFILENELNPEIYFDGDALDTYREKDLLRIRTALKQKGLEITIHAPFMDLSPGGVDTKIKKATIERLNQTIDVADFFQPQMVVFHPGYNKWFFDGNVEMWLDNSIKTWEPLVMKAEKMGIPLAVENIFEEEPSSLEKLISSINSPYFNFCFDTGHFNLFSTTTMKDWFDSLGNYFKEVHLHDNFKKSDDHLPIGDGDIDFDLFFKLIKQYDIAPIYTIEPHKIEHLERSLQTCKNYLTQIP